MSLYRVLVVDDDPTNLEAVRSVIRTLGHNADAAASAEEAQARFEQAAYDLVLTDLMLPGKSGLQLVEWLRARVPNPAVILITGHASLETAVQAMRVGASDYLTKPVEPNALKNLVEELLTRRPPSLLPPQSPDELDGLVARSRASKQVIERLTLAAAARHPVLLHGENGTGKQLCAAWIHRRSDRRNGPFATLHAGALPQDLVSTELFGSGTRRGRCELASGGTLFIDDIEALDAQAQVGLLKLLETSRYRKMGTDEEQPADVRIIVSASRDLATLVAAGQLREDLQLKLSAFSVNVPPLRERLEDVTPLAHHFLALFSEQYRKPALAFSEAAMAQLEKHSWPGNVRELRNAIEQAVILCQGLEIGPDLMPQPTIQPGLQGELHFRVGTAIKEVEREMIMRTLDANRGNKNRTAKQLGISRRSLYNKLERYRVAPAVQK